MASTSIHPRVRLFAYLSAAATILGFVTLVAYYAVDEPFGLINDAVTAVIALSALPVLYALHTLNRGNTRRRSALALAMGLGALLLAAVLQLLLVFGAIEFRQTAAAVPAAFGVFGLALSLLNDLANRNGSLPRALALLGMAAGIAYILVITGFLIGDENHPLTLIGGVASFILYPWWAIGFGRAAGQ